MRMRGHSIIDPADYVPPEQLAAWSERDPLIRQRDRLVAAGLWDDAREQALMAELRADVEAAVHAAEAMADPLPEDVHTGVFAA